MYPYPPWIWIPFTLASLAARLGAAPDPAALQGVHGDFDPVPLVCEPVLRRDHHVLQDEGGGGRSYDAHFLFMFPNSYSAKSHVKDERCNPLVLLLLVGHGKQDAGVGIRGVGVGI